MKKHKIITIIGSTKFNKDIKKFVWKHTKLGFLILFSPFCKETNLEVEDNRAILHSIHLQKIDMSDIIFVFDKNNYMGSSTKQELSYALSKNKKVIYYSKCKQLL